MSSVPHPAAATHRAAGAAWLRGAVALALLHALAPSGGAEQVAYIDPASSSFIVQALLAALAALAVTFRTWWARVRTLFGGAPAEEDTAPPPDGDA